MVKAARLPTERLDRILPQVNFHDNIARRLPGVHPVRMGTLYYLTPFPILLSKYPLVSKSRQLSPWKYLAMRIGNSDFQASLGHKEMATSRIRTLETKPPEFFD